MMGERVGKRRAQITLFVIIGLVALIVVGIFFSLSKPVVQKEPVRSVEDIADNAILQQYLSSCLDTVVNDELYKLGQSGGLPNDPGYPSAEVGSGDSARKILYGVTRNNDGDIPQFVPAPDYPDNSSSFSNMTINPRTGVPFLQFKDGFFGDTHFPATCERTGPNALGGAHACRYYIDNPPGTKGPSTQKQLQQRIEYQVAKCASLDRFNTATDGAVVSVGTPNVNLSFSSDVVMVGFMYDVTLKGSTHKLLPINRRYDVRYVSIAEFAYDLAREETRNLTFDPANPAHYKNIRSYRDGFIVGRSEVPTTGNYLVPVTPNKNATLITIIDSKSSLRSESYTFSFLIEHRGPVLEKLEDIDQCIPTVPPVAGAPVIGLDPDDSSVSISKQILNKCTFKSCDSNTPPVCICDYEKETRCIASDTDSEQDWQTFTEYSYSVPCSASEVCS